jgi:glycosyltransferase involved in cell wall biosynthesis
MTKLSVVLATYNEEKNIGDCLASIKDIADEIVIVDGTSTDATVSIAKDFGAKVIITENPPIFHINKQKALDAASFPWILQLDADERVSEKLAREVRKVITLSDEEADAYQKQLKNRHLFLRHQALIEERDGKIGEKEGNEYTAFFLPRRNFFLGRYMKYGGVYPDGVIRLVKNGKAHFPCKSVHEQIDVKGKVGWLEHDLYHCDSPTLDKYLMRWHRYTILFAKELDDKHVGKNPLIMFQYLIYYPLQWFLITYFRHKGFLDSWQGFVFSFFSSLRFPVTYYKYLTLKKL